MSDAPHTKAPVEKVTKLDAARRQLHTAIHLFLKNGDILSVHTLSMAAHAILRSLLNAKGGRSLIKDSEYIRPEHRKEFISLLNHPSNFLKHADRDPAEVLSFDPLFPIVFLIDCCLMYQALTGKFSRECAAYFTWFAFNYPEYLEPAFINFIKDLLDAEQASKGIITKEVCLEIIEKPSNYQFPNTRVFEADV